MARHSQTAGNVTTVDASYIARISLFTPIASAAPQRLELAVHHCRQGALMAHNAAAVTTALGLTKPNAVEPLQVCMILTIAPKLLP
jgi:hypothetical protein